MLLLTPSVVADSNFLLGLPRHGSSRGFLLDVSFGAVAVNAL
jgi:hypothetical protein